MPFIPLFLLTILALTSIVYYYFYKNTGVDINSFNKKKSTEITINENSSNIIKKIFYTSTDSLGNKFEIKSEFGEITIVGRLNEATAFSINLILFFILLIRVVTGW